MSALDKSGLSGDVTMLRRVARQCPSPPRFPGAASLWLTGFIAAAHSNELLTPSTAAGASGQLDSNQSAILISIATPKAYRKFKRASFAVAVMANPPSTDVAPFQLSASRDQLAQFRKSPIVDFSPISDMREREMTLDGATQECMYTG